MGHASIAPRGVAIGIVATFLMLAALGAPAASAHAQLEASTPLSGAPLETLPATLRLEFTEPILIDSASFTLVAPDSVAVPLGPAGNSNDDKTVELSVGATTTAAGTYSLRWSVTSATDGHDSSGLVIFSVGTGRAPPEAFLTSSTRAAWWEIAAETVLLFSLASIAAMPVYREASAAAVRAELVALAGTLALVAAALTASEPGGLIPESRAGQIRLLAGGLALLAAISVAWQGRPARAFGWLAWTAAVIAVSASGHAAGTDRPWLAITLTATHSLIALGWAGMLIAISARARDGDPRALTRRLTRIGVGGLALLVAAGIATSAIHLPGDRAVTTSLYGRTLLLKILLVVLVLSFTAANRWVVLPWLANRSRADGQSRLVLGSEAGAIALVLCFAAALSGTSPPTDSTLVNVAPRAAVVDQSADADDLSVRLSGQLADSTDDQLVVTVQGESGAPADIQRVILVTAFRADAAAEPETGERFDATAQADRPGQFAFPAVHLGRTGIWAVEVIVRRAGLADVASTFEIDTNAWQQASPRMQSAAWRWPVIPVGAWVLIGLAVLVPVVTLWAIRRQGPLAPLSGAIIMVAVAMIATGFGIQALQRTSARTPGHDLPMPSAADPVAGSESWAVYCLTCHGPAGAGIDSPDPLHQHGSRADLTDRASSQLSDGDLYWLIGNGIGNTQMPAYDEALSEQERWDLVAYLRQLQEADE